LRDNSDARPETCFRLFKLHDSWQVPKQIGAGLVTKITATLIILVSGARKSSYTCILIVIDIADSIIVWHTIIIIKRKKTHTIVWYTINTKGDIDQSRTWPHNRNAIYCSLSYNMHQYISSALVLRSYFAEIQYYYCYYYCVEIAQYLHQYSDCSQKMYLFSDTNEDTECRNGRLTDDIMQFCT